jgi:hypothetical protein
MKGRQEWRGTAIMMAQTLQLAFRIAFVWAGGFLLAVAVRALLPDQSGLTFAGKQATVFLPYARIGFWTCLLAALTVTGLVVWRAMYADFSATTLR